MHAFEIPATTAGVYHLVREGRVLYVGQSANCFQRVGSWISGAPGEFDSWHFYPCEVSRLNELEREHIEQFDPPLNKAGRTHHYRGVARPMLRSEVARHGGVLEFIKAQPAVIQGGVIRECGLSISNRELVKMPGFPKPIRARMSEGARGERWTCQWRRDDVLAWFQQREAA
jgi:hypothetical protein